MQTVQQLGSVILQSCHPGVSFLNSSHRGVFTFGLYWEGIIGSFHGMMFHNRPGLDVPIMDYYRFL